MAVPPPTVSLMPRVSSTSLEFWWSPDSYMAVAGGGGTYQLMYSYDGINWIRSFSSYNLFSAEGNPTGIGYGGGKWVAAGGDRLPYSTDGINWLPSANGSDMFSGGDSKTAAYGNGLWLAGGSGTNRLAYSLDGITWIPDVSGNTVFTTACQSVKYANDMWVAGGSGTNTLGYSADGINWTGAGSTVFSTAAYDLAYGGGKWVAVGQGTNFVAYSTDGINWTPSVSGNSFLTTSGIAVAYGAGLWVAGGQGANQLIYSYDGINWAAAASANAIFVGGECAGVSYMNGVWIATGAAGEVGRTAYSYDGINWAVSASGNSLFPVALTAVTSATVTTAPTGYLLQNAPPSKWVMGGNTSTRIVYSNDGVNWNPAANTVFTTQCNAVAYGAGLWVAGGSGTNQMAYSTDGISWIPDISGNAIFSTACYGVAYAGGQWVAGGQGSPQLAYSADGINWTGASSPFGTRCYSVAYGNSFWRAVGGNGSPSMVYSANGQSWLTDISGSAGYYAIYNVTYANNQWFASGDISGTVGKSIRSTGGVGANWTVITDLSGMICNTFAYGNGLYLAGGYNRYRIVYSYDGISWYPNTMGNIVFSTYCNSLNYTNGVWVASGNGTNQVAYSYDGFNWAPSGSGNTLVTSIGYSVATIPQTNALPQLIGPVANTTITGLTNNTNYSFIIQAIKDGAYSPPVPFRTVYTAARPQPVTDLAKTQSIVNGALNLTFTWTDPGDYAAYHVYGLKIATGTNQSIFSNLSPDLSGTLTLAGLDPTRAYIFTIQRGTDAGYSTAATISTTATTLFDPTTVAGLQFWVDATDTAGDGSAVADGTTISTWTDKSGKSNNGTSGNAVIQTDERGRYLNCTATTYNLATSSWIYQQTYTIFIVDKPLNYTSVYSLIGARAASSDDFKIIYDGNRGIVFSTYRDEQALGADFQAAGAPVNVWCFTNYGGKTAYWNKQISGKYNSEDSSIIDSLLSIGSYSGRLREILIYTGRMAEADRAAVTDYLYNKWLPPPAQFPLAPVENGAVLWLDAQDPKTFYSDTAGTQRGTDPIRFWKDKTGSGNNMISSDGSLDRINGLTTFTPAGLTQSATYLKTADATLFLVARSRSGQNYFSHGTLALTKNSLVSWRDGTTGNNNQFTDVGNLFVFYGRVRKGQLLSGTFVDASGAQASYTVEGLSQTFGTAPIILNGTETDYGEVLYYNRVLTDAEMAANAAYFSEKWRIAIPSLAPFSPPAAPGLQVWLDAADPYTLFRNAGTVTVWKDRSGNGNNAVPTGSPAGSAAGVVFTGSQKFQLPDGAMPRGAYSAYIVADVSGNSTILNAGSKIFRAPIWIAGGEGANSLVYSYDGSIWTATTNDLFAGSETNGIGWNGTYWVAVGYTTDQTVCIAKSTYGLNWAASTNNPFSGGNGIGIAWNGTYWVAVGRNGVTTVSIAKSTDGDTWTDSSGGGGNNPFTGGGGQGVAWNGTYWVAVGYNMDSTVCIARSTDGETWTNATNNPFSGAEGRGIAWNGTYWVAVGYNTGNTVSIAKSTDGLSWTTSTNNPFTGGGGAGQGIAWNGSYWVAVGQNTGGTVCIAKSTDGMSWTVATNNPFPGGQGSGIAWNGYWVAVGNNTGNTVTIAKSADGMSWTTSTDPFTVGNCVAAGLGPIQNAAVNVNSVLTAAGPTLYVAGGEGTNVLAYSADGNTWTASTNGNGIFSTRSHAVAYGGGKWVAGGEGTNQMAYSTDGDNWTASASGNAIFTTKCLALAYGNGLWVAGGQGTNRLAYSANGTSWTASTGSALITTKCSGVAYGDGLWVAVGDGTNTLVYSTNGITWTASASGNSVFTSVCISVAYGNGLWVAGGYDSNRLAYSTDGINWTASTSGNAVFSAFCYAAAYANGIWVAGGEGGNQMAYSIDGINWVANTNGNAIFTSVCRSFVYTNGRWVAGGYGTNQLAYSANGINWTASASGNAILTSNCAAVAAYTVPATLVARTIFDMSGGGTTTTLTDTNEIPLGTEVTIQGSGWVAVGNNTGNTVCIAKSTNGLDWTASTNNPFTGAYGYGIAYNGSYWLAVGSSADSSVTIVKSTDGMTWTNAMNNPFNNVAAYGAAWNGTYWVAVGANTASTVSIAKSIDGMTWAVATDNPFPNSGKGIAWNGTYWVAVGQNANPATVCIARSTNGMTWTDSSGGGGNNPFTGGAGGGNGIAWNGTYWVAVGQNADSSVCIATSTDGLTWTNATDNPFSTGEGFAIAWNGSYWVAGGEGTASIAKSTDGLIWTNSTQTVLTTVYGIAWNGSYWTATGAGGTATSTNGLDWTAANNNLLNPGFGIAAGTFTTTNTFGKTAIIESLYNGTGKSLFLSGLTGATDTSSRYQDASNNYIGWDLSQNYMVGTVKEILVYGAAHTTAQRQQVERYLKAKWYPSAYAPTSTALWLDSDPAWLSFAGTGIREWRSRGGATLRQDELWAQPVYSLDSVVQKRGVQFGSDGMATGFTATPFANTSSWSIMAVQRYDYSSDQTADAVNGTVSTAYETVPVENLGWLAAGDSGAVSMASSTDGLTWTTSDPFPGGAGRVVAWNGSYWLAGGDGTATAASNIIKSTYGTTWTPSIDSPFTIVNGLGWNGSYWIGVGRNGNSSVSITKSTDGLTWIDSSGGGGNNPFNEPGGSEGKGIAWNGNYWVAVGNIASATVSIVKSTDGLTWTASTNNLFSGGSGSGAAGNGIAWNGTYWVAVGNNATSTVCIARSTDGDTWTDSSGGGGNNPFTGGLGSGIAWNGSYWVAVGYNINNTVCIAKSTNGISWTDSSGGGGNNPFTGGGGQGIAWNGSYWIAVGTNNNTVNIAKSTDGLNWTDSSGGGGNNPFTGGNGSGIAYGSFGTSAYLKTGTAVATPSIAELTFIGATNQYASAEIHKRPVLTAQVITDLSGTNYVNGSNNVLGPGWVAVGSGAPFTSTDGLVWATATNNPFTDGQGNGIAWNGSYWVAVGANTGNTVCIAKSPDGITWTASTNNPFTGEAGRGIAWNGSYWIAVGQNTGGIVCIAKSTDGDTWTASTDNPFTGALGQGLGIAWNGTYWVAVGYNNITVTIAKSINGITWTVATNNPFTGGRAQGIAWNGSYWLVVGYNTNYTVCIAKSSDGMTWTNSTNNPFTNGGGNGIAWNGSYWVAVGLNGNDTTVSIAKSTDGMTWTNATDNPFSGAGGQGFGIAWNGTYWIAVGQGNGGGTSIVKSTDGMIWTVSTNNPFGSGNGIAYGLIPTTAQMTITNPVATITPLNIGYTGTLTPTIQGAMRGYIYELVVYNTALSTATRQAVEGYLAWKWGIPDLLPTTHPYFLLPP